ncbi:hypothetical protein [Clostridium septicum]|uniref:Uncharacterized protein n=1 Tax=Clostridium septicum TaxID=1504 RepID=A0A9N7PLE2_CLOSE|nr:hypothetical protein [Clostridium septicum]AYE35322.1 hypothetical protein CP523_13295 [Clostridium septicum]UEC20022.1 hypothetical protein LK444_11480 [Clostridium septicum]USS01921.1 hypothetical protein NH397_05690 [Clostridium septicum]
MTNITNELNKIKNAIFGKDVRQSIHDAIKECYRNASVEHDNANMEVLIARGVHETLNDRITNCEDKITNNINTVETKMNIGDKIKVSQIDKNQGKIDQTYLTDELLQQISGNAPINSIPPDKGVTTEKLADKSVTKSKIADDVQLFPHQIAPGKIVFDGLTAVKLPSSNAIVTVNKPSKLANSEYSIDITSTSSEGYGWIAQIPNNITLNEVETNTYGNKLTFIIQYSYNGTSKLSLNGRVYYKDETSETFNINNVFESATNKVAVIEVEFNKPIKSGTYLYVSPELNKTFTYTKNIYYYGGAIDDVYSKYLLDLRIDKTNRDIDVISSKIEGVTVETNHYPFSDRFISGSNVIIQTNNSTFSNNSAVLLDDKNSLGGNWWVKYHGEDNNDMPYMQIKISNSFISDIDKKIKLESYKDDGYIEFDIIIDSKKSFNVNAQIVGRYQNSLWTYFRDIPITHKGGRQVYKRKLYFEKSYLGDKLIDDYNFFAIYLVFKSRLTKEDVFYISGITNKYGSSLNPDKIKLERKNFTDKCVPYSALGDEVIKLLNYGANETKVSNEKIVFAGDSVTWGNGGLNDGYLEVIDEIVRFKYSNTVTIDQVTVNGANKIINSPKLFKSKACEIIGVDNSITFLMKSDKVKIAYAINRESKGAAICEVLVDNKVIDTFSTYNPRRKGRKTLTFNADGATRKFQLKEAFTYNHVVTHKGVSLTGELNRGSYGSKFPKGHDYMIIRALDNDEVKHTLFFKDAPAAGEIKITFDYGESITYAKTTVGELGTLLDSGLESYYGDGNVAFDPSNAVSLSSGLDFRKVDKDCFKTYNFASNKTREIKIRIKSLDPRVIPGDTPTFVFNFATDRNFEYMNAGIGGFQYNMFNKETGIINYKKLAEYEPDKIVALMGANDDWGKAEYPVYQPRIVQADYLEKNSYYWIANPIKNESNYNINDRWTDIKAFDKYSITLADNVVIGDVNKHDILIINKWGNDERYCQVRLIDSIDKSKKKITFLTPIDTELVNLDTKVHIKSIKKLGDDIDLFISKLRAYDNINPEIYLACMGVSNMNHRQLLGYREYIRYIAKKNNVKFIDMFTPTSEYQSTVERTITYEINSTGANDYIILKETENINPILRNVTVEVDGMNIFDGKNVRLSGGYGYYWNTDLTHGYKTTPTRLLLKEPIEAGKKIIVKGTTERYSGDYCHMGAETGKYLYGTTILKNLL